MLVTIKLPKQAEHDPKNKKTGPCAVAKNCTDTTGEHHTMLVRNAEEVEALRKKFGHITRVELVPNDWATKEEHLDALLDGSYVQGWDGFKHVKVAGNQWILCVAANSIPHEASSVELPAQVLYRG